MNTMNIPIQSEDNNPIVLSVEEGCFDNSITVNGKEDFKADEEVYLDGQIILLVNTYNGDTYEGM